MKKIIAITTTTLLIICFSTVSAHADRKTMEGFLLGSGAVLLGTAIINGIHHNSNPQYIPQKTVNYNYSYHPYKQRHHNRYNNNDRHEYKNKYRKKYTHNKRKGYWEIEKIWIDPLYETKWNPGHYNRKGQWISGRKINILIQDGYWSETKKWVRR